MLPFTLSVSIVHAVVISSFTLAEIWTPRVHLHRSFNVLYASFLISLSRPINRFVRTCQALGKWWLNKLDSACVWRSMSHCYVYYTPPPIVWSHKLQWKASRLTLALLCSGIVTTSSLTELSDVLGSESVFGMKGINKDQSYLFLALRWGVAVVCIGALFSTFITSWCCVTAIVQWWQWTELWIHVSHVPRRAVDDYRLWTGYLGGATCQTFPYASSVWIFYPDYVSLFVLGRLHLARQEYKVNSFYSNLVWIQQISGCGRGSHVVFGCDVIPIHGLHNRVALLRSNLFYYPMTLLNNTISRWFVRA